MELIIDSFAGGGGASTGIEMALGRSPDYAINHNEEALAMHFANHPSTIHLQENIYKVDPLDVVGKRKVGLLWASPDCKHFSKAKGGKPVKKEIRGLAWTIVLWAQRAKPRVIILENVEEFQTWGPLKTNEKGQQFPDPDRKGETFQDWVNALKKEGYKIEWRELRACDYGAPTTRKRLFIIARRDRQPIVWPEPTHGAPDDPEVIAGNKLPWLTAADIIDWSLPCPSIFETSEQIMERWSVRANRPLADNTMARIAKGVKRYVLDALDPFIVTCNHGGDGFRGQSLDDPFNTVTASRDAHGLVMPHVTKFNTGSVGSNIKEPLPTITANSYLKRPGGAAPIGLVAPLLTSAQQGGSHRRADEPHRTITASDKDQNQVIAASLMRQFGNSVGGPVDDPVGTVTAGGGGKSALIATTMVQTGYGERQGQEPRALDLDKPLGTIVAGGAKHAAVAAFLAQHNTGVVGHDARKPVSTITSGGEGGATQQAVVSAGMVNMRGSDRRGADIHSPVGTITAQGTHLAEVRAFLMKYYGQDQDPRLEEPLHTVTSKGRFGIVTVEGEDYEIADIGMRMLTPRELFLAQGFPEYYTIDKGVFADGSERILNKTAQVRMCGNSVCPPIAAALVWANCSDMAAQLEAA